MLWQRRIYWTQVSTSMKCQTFQPGSSKLMTRARLSLSFNKCHKLAQNSALSRLTLKVKKPSSTSRFWSIIVAWNLSSQAQMFWLPKMSMPVRCKVTLDSKMESRGLASSHLSGTNKLPWFLRLATTSKSVACLLPWLLLPTTKTQGTFSQASIRCRNLEFRMLKWKKKAP